MSIFLLAANKEKTNIIEVNFYNPEPLFFAAKLLVMTSLVSWHDDKTGQLGVMGA